MRRLEGLTFRQLRRRRNLTLAAASVLGDVDPGTLSRIENGLVKPHPLTVVKLAQGLGIDARRMREILTTPPSEDELELEDAQ